MVKGLGMKWVAIHDRKDQYRWIVQNRVQGQCRVDGVNIERGLTQVNWLLFSTPEKYIFLPGCISSLSCIPEYLHVVEICEQFSVVIVAWLKAYFSEKSGH